MPKRLDNLTILVVDDSKDNRILVNLLLRHEGAVVDLAASGQEALQKTAASDYAIVLMDIQMPDMDGYETLRALHSKGFLKPVIALTAHAMKEEKLKTAAAGFKDHVTKPVDRETLVRTILKHVQQ